MKAAAVSAPDAGATSRRLPLLLRRAWFSLNQAFRRRIAHLDLTPDQYTVLRNLSEFPPAALAQRDLCRLMSSDPNTVASLLERMEAAALIRRRPDPADRRTRRIRLTRAGEAKFQLARELALGLEAEVLGGLPEDERISFLGKLEQVADACRHAANGGSVRRSSIRGR